MTRRLLPLLLVVLAGCAAQPRVALPPDLVERRDALGSLEDWSFAGRMGVKYDTRGFTGALNWQQRSEHVEARFHGPLGAGAFRISGVPDAMLLELSDGRIYELGAAQDALQAQLGWTIPVDAMRYWLLALPAPQWPATQRVGADGNLETLEQRGWEIFYERYQSAGTWSMPRKLVISSADVTIRLVIRDWQLGPN